MTDNPSAAESWDRMRTTLPQNFGDGVWSSWLRHLDYHSFADGVLTLSVPTPFLRDWVTTHYSARLLTLARQVMEEDIKRLNIYCRDAAWSQFKTRDLPPPKNVAAADELEKADAEQSFGTASALDPKFTFDNFVVGKSNELAFAAARRVADADKIPFNPLFLYGGVGLGKTHLMHAIAWAVNKRAPNKRIMYLSAEKFMYQFIRSIRFRNTIAFKDKFRSVDLLMVDDVQFIADRDATREEFFHTFNALVDQKRQIIISADKSPDDLKGMEERMRSRLGGGLVADIHPATYELRLSILQNKATDIGLSLEDKIYDFIARRITTNIRVLEGALHKISAHSQLIGKPVSVDEAAFALRDVIKAQEKQVTIDHIQRRVAEHFNIRLADMVSSRRTRTVVVPRQVAMYLVKQLTPRSLPEIGRHFGNRDHTTVMHAVNKIEDLKVRDSQFEEDIELLRRTLGG